MVTAIGVVTGGEVIEGTKVLEVSGRPVFVLQGDVPIYRTLRPLMTGADVAELQAALTRLGCDTTADAGVFASATKECVTSFYADAGYDPVPSSANEQADLAAAEQALVEAQAAADAAQVALNAANIGPTTSDVLAADSAVRAAQRGYDDAVASGGTSIVQADGEVTDAQMALDQALAVPDTRGADIAAAQRTLATAIAVANEAGRRPEATTPGSDDALALVQANAAVAAAQAALDQALAAPDTRAADIVTAQRAVTTAAAAADGARRNRDSTVAGANDALVLAKAARAALDDAADVTVEYSALGQALAARDLAQAALDHVIASTGPTVAQGEIIFAPSLPARAQQVVSVLGPVGDSRSPDGGSDADGSGSGDLATLAAGELVVEMRLGADSRSLVRAAMPVELLDEASNMTYAATITDIAETATVGADGKSGYTVVLTPKIALPDKLSRVNLRVTITAASTDTATLVVPLAAVSSAPDGSTNVSIIGTGPDPVVVAVTAGLSADGFVSIVPAQPGSLVVGDRVVVGR